MGRAKEKKGDDQRLEMLFPQLREITLPKDQENLEISEWFRSQRRALEQLGVRVPGINDLDVDAQEVLEILERGGQVIEGAGEALRDHQLRNLSTLGHTRLGSPVRVIVENSGGFEEIKQKHLSGLVSAAGVFVAEGERRLANAIALKYPYYGADDDEYGREAAIRIREAESADEKRKQIAAHYVDNPRKAVLEAMKLISAMEEGCTLDVSGVLTFSPDFDKVVLG